MPMTPALSTMWTQLRHQDLGAFLSDAAALGFPAVELGHVVTPRMLQAMPTSPPPPVRVLHHPCPNPGGIPELSDPDESRRAVALAAAEQTIEWAARLGARAVVLHLGLVGVDRRWENALRARWLQGEAETPAFELLSGFVAGLRAGQAPPHLDAARRSLDHLVIAARHHGVRLGLENGEWVMAIPTLHEAEQILADSDPAVVGLWCDTGHATILERLGVDSLDAWLALAGPRLVGLHYHDVAGLRDHLLPGRGTIDWTAVASRVTPAALPTCEFDWYYTPEEIVAGANELARHGLVDWGGTPG